MDSEVEDSGPTVIRPNSPPPPTADEIAVAKQEHYEAIREKEVEVRLLEGNHNVLKERANDSKKEFETADKALRFLIARGYEIAKKWPTRVRAIVTLIAPKIEFGQEFDVLEIDEYKGTVRVFVDDETPEGDWLPIGKEVEVVAWGDRPIQCLPEPEADDSEQMAVPLSTLFDGGLLKSLTEAGLATVGALAAHTESGKRLTDLPGVGLGKAEKIENRMLQFWADNTNADEVEEEDTVE